MKEYTVVVAGEHDEYHVVCLAKTKEIANAVVAFIKENDTEKQHPKPRTETLFLVEKKTEIRKVKQYICSLNSEGLNLQREYTQLNFIVLEPSSATVWADHNKTTWAMGISSVSKNEAEALARKALGKIK